MSKLTYISLSVFLAILVLVSCNKPEPTSTSSNQTIVNSSANTTSEQAVSSEESSQATSSEEQETPSSTVVSSKSSSQSPKPTPPKASSAVASIPAQVDNSKKIIEGNANHWRFSGETLMTYSGPAAETINVPGRVGNQKITKIDRDCFQNTGAQLKNVVLSEGIVSIDPRTFFFCSNLRQVTIPSTLKDIAGINSDSNSPYFKVVGSSDNPHLKFEDGVVYNSNKTKLLVYSSAKPQKSFTIPSSVKIIEEGAFSAASNLEQVTIPNSVTAIEFYAFRDCKALKSLKIPDSVATISGKAFYGCSSLRSVELSKKLKVIEFATFASCDLLDSVVIPASVTQIDDNAFLYCDKLKTLKVVKGSYAEIWGTKNNFAIEYIN